MKNIYYYYNFTLPYAKNYSLSFCPFTIWIIGWKKYTNNSNEFLVTRDAEVDTVDAKSYRYGLYSNWNMDRGSMKRETMIFECFR